MMNDEEKETDSIRYHALPDDVRDRLEEMIVRVEALQYQIDRMALNVDRQRLDAWALVQKTLGESCRDRTLKYAWDKRCVVSTPRVSQEPWVETLPTRVAALERLRSPDQGKRDKEE